MMKKKILIRSVVGFLLGMIIGNLIRFILSGGTVSGVPDLLLSRFGTVPAVVFMQTFFSGLQGAIPMGGTVVYEMEDWSLFRVTGIHFLITMGSFLLISLVMGWCHDTGMYMTIIGIMIIAYILIWLIMYIIYHRQVQELNDLLDQKKRSKEKR